MLVKPHYIFPYGLGFPIIFKWYLRYRFFVCKANFCYLFSSAKAVKIFFFLLVLIIVITVTEMHREAHHVSLWVFVGGVLLCLSK